MINIIKNNKYNKYNKYNYNMAFYWLKIYCNF